jgi:hypothetical protein
MGKFLVTAGPVFAKLDDNKIFTNRARGLWAKSFHNHLKSLGHEVVLAENLDIESYKNFVLNQVPTLNGAVMAAAVINYMPEVIFNGKMPTDLDHVNVKLVRTPYVIDEIRKINPKLCVIGCKLTSQETPESTIEKAQHLIERSRASAVVANDLSNLKTKFLVFPDGAVLTFENAFDQLFNALTEILTDVHFTTIQGVLHRNPNFESEILINKFLDKFRHRFLKNNKVFGSIAIRVPTQPNFFLMTPRKKTIDILSSNCVLVHVNHQKRTIYTDTGKATMNAPLLASVLSEHPNAIAALHLHEFLPNVNTLPYAPPGTLRDTFRNTSPPFNIASHGFIAFLDQSGNILGI